MVDIATISGAISSLKTAGEIAKSMMGLRDASLIQEKVIELQSTILSAQSSAITAQSEQFICLDKIRELEEEVRKIKAWESEKQNYELVKIGRGGFAYCHKTEPESKELSYNICASCYENGCKSILQEETRVPGMDRVLVCHKCSAEIYKDGQWRPEHSGRKRSSR